MVRNKIPEYKIWRAMNKRCRPNYVWANRYSERGITICDRWIGLDGFTNFLIDMGSRPSVKHSIDRIDNDGNYEPGNCRWATYGEQERNRDNSVWITFEGRTRLLLEWCEMFGISYQAAYGKLYRGTAVEKVFEKTGVSGRSNP